MARGVAECLKVRNKAIEINDKDGKADYMASSYADLQRALKAYELYFSEDCNG